jgi:hypothetical protein
MSNILALLLPESSLALLLILEENGALTSLSKVLVSPDFHRVLVSVIVLKEGDHILRLASER